jgi:LPS sulfotransferase NodH
VPARLYCLRMRAGIEFVLRHGALLRLLVRHKALETGALAGRSDYLKFIVLTRPRTGWHLLRSALHTHSQVVVLGELFKDPETIIWDKWPYHFVPAWYGRRISALIRSDPIRFLETKVFHTYPESVLAVGFKIAFHHAREAPWKPIWAYLKQLKGLKVIHLRRRNILKAHLSLTRAARSGVWLTRSGGAAPPPPVHLDAEECLAVFQETRARETACDLYFEDHERTEVFYEDLCDNYTEEIDRLQVFLGVRSESIRPKTHKQATQSLLEAIENYRELEQRFRNTPWEAFFHE